MLVNNAGVMAIPELQTTSQGWEMQFATNFLGHFALVNGLHEALRAAQGARIVSLSSSAQLMGPVVFDDLHFRFRSYEPWAVYAQGETAGVLMAVEATRRWQHEGIVAIATNLQKHTGGLRTPVGRRKNAGQGAATTVLLAASPLLKGVGGRYFEDCNEATVVDDAPLTSLALRRMPSMPPMPNVCGKGQPSSSTRMPERSSHQCLGSSSL